MLGHSGSAGHLPTLLFDFRSCILISPWTGVGVGEHSPIGRLSMICLGSLLCRRMFDQRSVSFRLQERLEGRLGDA